MGIRLASRVGSVDASGIRRVFDLARTLKHPINLSIGQPDFDVPQQVKQAAIHAINEGHNGYTPTQGLEALRDQLRREEHDRNGRVYAEEELIITSGVSGGIFLALCVLIDPGDEVIIPDPYFVMYKHLVRLFGGVPVYLDTYAAGFGIDPERLEACIGPRTKVLLLNSPANPTGRVMTASELDAVAAVCARHDLTVISDEIYRAFAYEVVGSLAGRHAATLVLGGHSKSYGMTGWRLGFAAGPGEIVQAMAKIQQYSFVCAPSVAQYAALACPQVDLTDAIATYRAKRDLVCDILSRAFALPVPGGAFYLFVQAPGGWTGSGFAEHCIRNEVLVIPGNVFSERDTHFRVCYTVDDATLRAGAEKLVTLAGDPPPLGEPSIPGSPGSTGW